MRVYIDVTVRAQLSKNATQLQRGTGLWRLCSVTRAKVILLP
jgi:hypothetical protein